MPSLPVEQQPGNEIVALTICVIALMQALVWWRTREPGMAWFAGAYTLAAVLVVTDEALANATPITVYLLSIYATRGCLAIGLAQYLDFPPHRRPALVLALTLPAVLFAPAFLVGLTPGGPLAALPLLWADFGFAIICLAATRRDPGAGHGLLALGALIGPAGSLFDHWRGPGPHLRQDFPAAAVCLGIILLVVCLMRKSRDSRIAQAHAQRMSNYYATLSHTNQAILRIKEPVALYNEICRICVESAQAKLACVHEAQGNQVWRTASAGAASQILEGYQNPWDMTTPQGKRSYTAQVLQEGRRVICNDYQNEPRTARWRHLPRQHEIRAAAFLPLRRDGRTVAVLMVAAGEVGIFDEALVQLLDEMIGDISFALDNIDREARHLESARQVEAGLERFARLFQSAPVASAIISIAERRVLDVNDAICELHRATREEMIGRTTESLAYRAVREDRERFYEVLKRE
ncbi:MAG: GAF domain-containing protein, partial [Betaproteobacteria bacterium]